VKCPRAKIKSVRAERQEQQGIYQSKGIECLKLECYNDYSEVNSASRNMKTKNRGRQSSVFFLLAATTNSG
jgi:hypothetical protein